MPDYRQNRDHSEFITSLSVCAQDREAFVDGLSVCLECQGFTVREEANMDEVEEVLEKNTLIGTRVLDS